MQMRLRVDLSRIARKLIVGLMLQLSIGIAFTIFLSGCGRKAPPVPPHQESSQAATDPRFLADGGLLQQPRALSQGIEGVTSKLAGGPPAWGRG